MQELKNETWKCMEEEVMCFNGNDYVGNHKNLVSWAQKEWRYEDFRPNILYDAIAEEAHKDYFLKNPVTYHVLMLCKSNILRSALLEKILSNNQFAVTVTL